jgi:hypothetical protein
MLTTVCGAKGGQGCTTVTAGLALIGDPAVVVDTGGDVPALLGESEPAGPGVVDLLLSDMPVTVEALGRLLVEVGTIGVVPRGADHVGEVTTDRWQELAGVLAGDEARWLVDTGTGPARQTATVAGARVLLVARNCFLALRRLVQCSLRPDGVVLVTEPHRALDVLYERVQRSIRSIRRRSGLLEVRLRVTRLRLVSGCRRCRGTRGMPFGRRPSGLSIWHPSGVSDVPVIGAPRHGERGALAVE